MCFEDHRARVLADCDRIISDCRQLIAFIESYNEQRAPTPRIDCEDVRVALSWAKRIRQRVVDCEAVPDEWVNRMLAAMGQADR